MAAETGSVANYDALFDLVRSKLTSTAFMGAGNEWQEIVYDTAGINGITKRLALKNTGESGEDEIWITFQQFLSPYDSRIAGFYIDFATGYNGLTPGWAGLRLPTNGNGGFFALPNTGITERDEIKYWLVADHKRVILAVHTEYLLGGGQVMWMYNGYLLRFDPPSQYPAPHLRSSPQSSAQSYTSGGSSTGYQSDTTHYNPHTLDPIYQNVVLASVLNSEPPCPNPDGSHPILPMWVYQNDTYVGIVDGLYYTDPSVGHGNTFEMGGATYVALQNYLPGHYVALRLS